MVLCLAFLTSCAFSRTEMKVDYTPNIQAVSLANPSAKSVAIAQVKDERGVTDPTVIFQKNNAYGKTTGSYSADKPVAEIIRAGLIQALEDKNYRLAPVNANHEIRTTLQDLDYEFIQGIWSGTLKTKMTARFEVIDKSSGKEIWRDTIIGRSSVECSFFSSNDIIQALSLTTDDVISRLLNNQYFQDAFR